MTRFAHFWFSAINRGRLRLRMWREARGRKLVQSCERQIPPPLRVDPLSKRGQSNKPVIFVVLCGQPSALEGPKTRRGQANVFAPFVPPFHKGGLGGILRGEYL